MISKLARFSFTQAKQVDSMLKQPTFNDYYRLLNGIVSRIPYIQGRDQWEPVCVIDHCSTLDDTFQEGSYLAYHRDKLKTVVKLPEDYVELMRLLKAFTAAGDRSPFQRYYYICDCSEEYCKLAGAIKKHFESLADNIRYQRYRK